MVTYTPMYIHMDTTFALLHLLADPSRLTIVESLRAGECTVGQIVARVGIQQSGVSRHLRNWKTGPQATVPCGRTGSTALPAH